MLLLLLLFLFFFFLLCIFAFSTADLHSWNPTWRGPEPNLNGMDMDCDYIISFIYLLSQWLTFKLLRITYLVGRMKSKLLFHGLGEWVYVDIDVDVSKLRTPTKNRWRWLPYFLLQETSLDFGWSFARFDREKHLHSSHWEVFVDAISELRFGYGRLDDTPSCPIVVGN